MNDKLLTTREVAQLLRISDKEVIDMAAAGKIPNFKVAKEFLRFKREDVLSVKDSIKKHLGHDRVPQRNVRFKEFIYFNDFYLVCSALIVVLLAIIFRG